MTSKKPPVSKVKGKPGPKPTVKTLKGSVPIQTPTTAEKKATKKEEAKTKKEIQVQEKAQATFDEIIADFNRERALKHEALARLEVAHIALQAWEERWQILHYIAGCLESNRLYHTLLNLQRDYPTERT